MSKATDGRSRLSRWRAGCKHMFWRQDCTGVEASMDDNNDDNTRYSRDGGGIDNTGDDGNGNTTEVDGIEPGTRTDRWFERIERMVRENRSRSVQNQNLLKRVDFRTVWIARLLIALLAGILGSLILDIAL